MKLITSAFFLTLLLFSGCNQELDINSPSDNATKKVKWLTISDNPGLSVEATRTWSKFVNGTNGAFFYSTKSLSSTISAYVEIWVPAGAFTGWKTISASLNSETLYADFAPTPLTFNTPVYYTVEYFGVDLTGINPEDVDFYYIDVNGNMVKAEYAEIYVEDGWLCVVDAKLPHFSRYGFVN